MASIHFKPKFTRHRSVTGAPVAADSTNLATLFDTPVAGAGASYSGNAKGWDSVDAVVKLSGGASPTVSVQPLLLIEIDGSLEFVKLGNVLGPFSSGDHFSVDGVHGGRVFLRIDAVTGAPTGVDLHLAGGKRSNEGSI
jgi:hypothetical protein